MEPNVEARQERQPLPELELPAAEAVLGQIEPLRRHAEDLARFIVNLRPRLRAELEAELAVYPKLVEEQAYTLGAVDSASRVKNSAALTTLMAVAFRTSATRSEDARAVVEQLDASYETEAVARLVRDQLEAELLGAYSQGGDQLVILDNSFLSLAENASRAWLALERVETPVAREVLARYCGLHLGPEGSLLRVLSNASVVALPKVAEAQSLTFELYQRIGLPPEEQRTPAALAQRDRVLLRGVLRPGEYLRPRSILGPQDRSDRKQRERFFHRAHGPQFPDREKLLDLYGVGRPEDGDYGLDLIYFRPRRPDGASDGPVLRVEVNRQIARSPRLLERVLGTIELHGDGEHSEPLPQLLADHVAKSSVAFILDALVEASVIELIGQFSDASGENGRLLEVIRWLHEEARS
jgi:hypothetical protein